MWTSLTYLKLLTTLGTAKKGLKAAGDDAALLRRIRDADPAAGTRFLEHLVFQKRSIVRLDPFLIADPDAEENASAGPRETYATRLRVHRPAYLVR